MSVLRRKSWQDIRRRRARSLFTVGTIAAAVAGLSLFAMPTLMDRAMKDQIAEDRLHDIRFLMTDVVLDPAERADLVALPGVTALETRTLYSTRVFVGDRRENALVVGVEDFADQAVNVVGVDAGTAPAVAEALSDIQNGRTGRLPAEPGETVAIEDNSGALHEVVISGRGGSLDFSGTAVERAVVYVPQAMVNELAGSRGVNSLEFRVRDPASAAATAASIRSAILDLHPEVVFTELPDVREPGSWPGQEEFNNFGTLFYVGAFLALISALVLIANTMTTMVAEQVKEIAVMKAIGGRRRQIMRAFLRTVVILGGIGSLVGAALGVPFANLLVGVIGRQFYGVVPAWGIAPVPVGASLLIGIVGTALAAVPALRRAARISVREGLDRGSSIEPSSILERVVRRVPLPHDARVGLRNLARRRGRTLGTVLQVGLAVGVALGFLAIGLTVATVTADVWDAQTWDMMVIQRANVELDDTAAQVIDTTPGVDAAHPALNNALEIDGSQYESWGLPTDFQLYEPELEAGRWFEAGDAGAPVAVFGHALAAKRGIEVGERVTVGTARGPAELEVIGIDTVLIDNGTVIYVPITTFQALLGRSDTNTFWVRGASQAEPDIDRLAATIEDDLQAAGTPVRTLIRYVERDANLAGNRVLIGVLAVMGVPTVVIGMIGLVNMMTMNVIERTREIGILRSIGARAKDVRRIFRSEALAVTVAGWLLAIPLGWLIGAGLSWVLTQVFDFGTQSYLFPVASIPIALVVTVALAWVVVLGPVRRAVRLRPGVALRYE